MAEDSPIRGGGIGKHMPTQRVVERLENDHTYHAPTGTQAARYEAIRALAFAFATELTYLCPESRELSLALTNIEQAVFYANASIARNE